VQRAGGRPEILRNREFEETTPSVVYFPPDGEEDLIVVGTEAMNQVAVAGDDIAQLVKRAMGSRDFRFITSSGAEYTAEAISAIILKRLAADAAQALGEPVTDVVVTVPAYFDDARRTATRDAARIAGLNVLGLLNEPTAAALAFGIEAGGDNTILVYDLGGGTFDVTILRVEDNDYWEMHTLGDAELGGSDFDNEIVKHVARSIEKQGGPALDFDDLVVVAVLQEKAEQAKRALTAGASATVSLALDTVYRVTITREEFEAMTAYLLGRTEELTVEALEEAGLTWDEIDQVLLVGGSSKMPMVSAMMERLSGRRPGRHVHPELAVALGAGIRAAMLSEPGERGDGQEGSEPEAPVTYIGGERPTLHLVASHALGVIALGPDMRTPVNRVVIPCGAAVPGQGSIDIRTMEGQRSMLVEVTQGDDKDPAYVVKVGSKSIPLPHYPPGAPLRVTYHYDIDQTIFVHIEDLTTHESLGSFEVDRIQNLPPDEIESETMKVRRLGIA
jgi:molecular chaperone DnaK